MNSDLSPKGKFFPTYVVSFLKNHVGGHEYLHYLQSMEIHFFLKFYKTNSESFLKLTHLFSLLISNKCTKFQLIINWRIEVKFKTYEKVKNNLKTLISDLWSLLIYSFFALIISTIYSCLFLLEHFCWQEVTTSQGTHLFWNILNIKASINLASVSLELLALSLVLPRTAEHTKSNPLNCFLFQDSISAFLNKSSYDICSSYYRLLVAFLF